MNHLRGPFRRSASVWPLFLLLASPLGFAAPPQLSGFESGSVITAEEINEKLQTLTSYTNEVRLAIAEAESAIASSSTGLDELGVNQSGLINDHESRANSLVNPSAADLAGRHYCEDSYLQWLYKDVGYASRGWTVRNYEYVFSETGYSLVRRFYGEPEHGFYGNPYQTQLQNSGAVAAVADLIDQVTTGTYSVNTLKSLSPVSQRGHVWWAGYQDGTFDPLADGQSLWNSFDIAIQCSDEEDPFNLGGAQ